MSPSEGHRSSPLACTFVIPAGARATLTHFVPGFDGIRPSNFILIDGEDAENQIETKFSTASITSRSDTDRHVVIVSNTAELKLTYTNQNFTSIGMTK